MLIPLIVIILLVVAGVGAFIFMGNGSKTASDAEGTPTVAPTEEPLPTEEEVDLKAYKIQVLNGTEVAGEAGKLKTALEKAGYEVAGTGNADKTTYTKTIVQAKESVKSGFLSKLKSELENTYELGTDEILKDDNDNDVVVIIGIPSDKQKTSSDSADTKDTATPAPTAGTTDTPTPSPTP